MLPMPFLAFAGGGAAGPALSLPFYQMTPAQIAAAGVTAKRSGLGWQYDATGKITTCPNNYFTYSADMANAAWSAAGATVSATGVADPFGGNTAVTYSGLTTNSLIQQTVTGAVPAGVRVIVSSWLRGSGTIRVGCFDDSNGSTNSSQITLTSTWTRYSLAYTYSAASGFRSARAFFVASGDTATSVDVCGAQLERVTYETSPRTYNPTTSAAYYGPRLDYDPVTLAAKGLLVEEARTNLLTQSNGTGPLSTIFGGTGSNPSVTFNYALAPDGTMTAKRVQFNRGAGVTGSDYSVVAEVSGTTTAASSGITYTQSLFVRATSGTQKLFLYLANSAYTGLAGTVITVDDTEWTRVENVKTTTGSGLINYSFGLIGTDGSGSATSDVIVWGGQLEVGSFATSYKSTTTAAVTMAADAPAITGSSFSALGLSAAEGTLFADFTTPASGTRTVVAMDDATANESVILYTSGTSLKFKVVDGGVTQCDITIGTVAANTNYKVAARYKANDFAAVMNGGTVQADVSGSLPTVDRLRIGASQSGEVLCGHIKDLRAYNSALPDASLLALVA